MKHLKRVLALSLLLITIMACSSDDNANTEDNQGSIIGTWKLSSSSTNGVADSLDACDLQTTLVIASSQIDITEYWGDNCLEIDTYSINYTISGKNLTISDSGFSYTSEITTLTATTLSIKDIDEGDVYIETYTRQ